MTQVNQSETRNSDNHFIRKVMKKPLLEREYELELATRWRDHDDHRAMHELVLAYGRLVVSAASKYRHYGLSLGDLIQEGNIGLMQAARRFEPERGRFQPTLRGGYAHPFRIIFCGTGRSCVPVLPPHTRHYFSA